MRVIQIMRSKPDATVVTIVPGAKVSEAAQLLSEKRIGAVIVSSDGRTLIGILSERDIVRELGRRGAACLDDTVEAIMTANPVGCAKEDESDHVFQKMTDGRFRHLPVLEDGRMIGLISIGDVVKCRLSELAMEKDALEGMIMGH